MTGSTGMHPASCHCLRCQPPCQTSTAHCRMTWAAALTPRSHTCRAFPAPQGASPTCPPKSTPRQDGLAGASVHLPRRTPRHAMAGWRVHGHQEGCARKHQCKHYSFACPQSHQCKECISCKAGYKSPALQFQQDPRASWRLEHHLVVGVDARQLAECVAVLLHEGCNASGACRSVKRHCHAPAQTE